MSDDKRNNFRVRNWGDVIAVATLISMFLGVVAWGLKLESELNTERNARVALQERLAKVEEEVDNGILPRAEERVSDLERRMDKHEDHGK